MVSKKSRATEFDLALGQKIKLFRKRMGLSQKILSQELSISCQQIQKYESGQNRISIERLAQISQALDTPLTSFVLENGENDNRSVTEFDKKQEIELISAWSRISNSKVRKAILRYIKSLADFY